MMDEIGKDKLEEPRQFGGEEAAQPEEDFYSESGEAATEDEQMDYDLLVTRARKMIFGQSREKILTMLGSSESPSKGIGKVASMIIKNLRQSAKQNGKEIDDEVSINAGTEIAEDLSDLAKSAGVYKYDSDADEQSELEDAMLWGVKFYGDGELQSGETTPEMQADAARVTKEGNQREYDNAPKPPQEKTNPVKEGVKQGIVEGAMQQGQGEMQENM